MSRGRSGSFAARPTSSSRSCDVPGGPAYFSYVAWELPALCQRWFRLDARRENTYIAGESMGGYGA